MTAADHRAKERLTQPPDGRRIGPDGERRKHHVEAGVREVHQATVAWRAGWENRHYHSRRHRDCRRMVMSKFLTIDVYIDQTTAVYAPTATSVKKMIISRPDMSSEAICS